MENAVAEGPRPQGEHAAPAPESESFQEEESRILQQLEELEQLKRRVSQLHESAPGAYESNPLTAIPEHKRPQRTASLIGFARSKLNRALSHNSSLEEREEEEQGQGHQGHQGHQRHQEEDREHEEEPTSAHSRTSHSSQSSRSQLELRMLHQIDHRRRFSRTSSAFHSGSQSSALARDTLGAGHLKGSASAHSPLAGPQRSRTPSHEPHSGSGLEGLPVDTHRRASFTRATSDSTALSPHLLPPSSRPSTASPVKFVRRSEHVPPYKLPSPSSSGEEDKGEASALPPPLPPLPNSDSQSLALSSSPDAGESRPHSLDSDADTSLMIELNHMRRSNSDSVSVLESMSSSYGFSPHHVTGASYDDDIKRCEAKATKYRSRSLCLEQELQKLCAVPRTLEDARAFIQALRDKRIEERAAADSHRMLAQKFSQEVLDQIAREECPKPAFRDLRPIWGGMLAKQGGFKSWSNKLFVLEGKYLYYFNSERDEVPKGVINVQSCQVRIAGNVSVPSKQPFCFSLFSYRGWNIEQNKNFFNRTYYFCTESVQALNDWMSVLSKAGVWHTLPTYTAGRSKHRRRTSTSLSRLSISISSSSSLSSLSSALSHSTSSSSLVSQT